MGLQAYPKEALDIFKKAHVALLVPVFDKPDYRFMLSIVRMVAHSVEMGVHMAGMAVAHRSKTVSARNRLMKATLERKDVPITHLLWMDDDHAFEPNILCNLLSRDKEYICSLMFQKLAPHYPTIYRVSDKDKHGYHAYIKWPRSVFRIDAGGFGFVLMKRETAAKIKPPYFEEQTGAFGQDLHFCSKLRDLGIPMYCDGTQSVLHIGYEPPVYGEVDFMRYQEAELKKVADHVKKTQADHGETKVEVNNVLV